MAVVLYGPALALSSGRHKSGHLDGCTPVYTYGLVELGGFGRIWEINEMGGRLKFFNMQFDIYNHNNLFNVVLGTTLIWCSSYCVSQTQVQRYCNMGSKRNAKLSLYANLPGLIILCLMATFSGMVIYAKYHACDPVTLGLINRHDQLMPYYVMDTLSKYPGVPGLFVACVFSGSLSTLSSGFNSLAAITWEDLLKDRINVKSEAQALNITKLIAMSYGLLSIGFSFVVGNAGTVMQASMALTGAMRIITWIYKRFRCVGNTSGRIAGNPAAKGLVVHNYRQLSSRGINGCIEPILSPSHFFILTLI
ncbi:unnamed protein product [Medioppia subpectinata]|uniref:Sodium-coupled monocarboxylate transporter 1 n=1 Tax=Medioppia subpectinata TaxID=1979941 RepID=A0A7R9QF61_9ACAR|nr:unnamed protein product [Medioppia subpectinata]CAG2119262.1 unnamed protein product [Medioppia subpectinata]